MTIVRLPPEHAGRLEQELFRLAMRRLLPPPPPLVRRRPATFFRKRR